MSEAEIIKTIKASLEKKLHLDLIKNPIHIKLENDAILMEGTVPSLSHKRLAGVLAWWVPGSQDVINSLEVNPPEEDSDDEITDAVVLALEKDKLVNHSNIKISTKNWVVTLDGAVQSEAAKNAAQDDAWYIWGVNGVVSRLTVTK